MNKSIHLALWLGMALPVTQAWSLQAMDEQSMAGTTGQDGISIGIQLPSSALAFSEAAIIDTNGISGSSTHTATASLVMAPTTYRTTEGVRFFNADTGTTLATQPILIDIDADGGAGGSMPLLNVLVSLPSDLKRIRIDPFSIYAATGATSIFTAARANNTVGTLRPSGVTELLRVGNNGLDVIFKSGDPVKINFQLATEDQGRFFTITGGNFLQLKNDPANPIQLMSKNATVSSLKFNLSLAATNQTTGFSLVGFYGDVTAANGFTFGKSGTTDKIDLVVSDVVAGTSGLSNAGSFAGLKNASIGSVGLIGATVSNLKVNVKGL